MCMFCQSLFVLFLLAIVLSVHLRFTTSDYLPLLSSIYDFWLPFWYLQTLLIIKVNILPPLDIVNLGLFWLSYLSPLVFLLPKTLFIFIWPDEGYSKTALCALNYISIVFITLIIVVLFEFFSLENITFFNTMKTYQVLCIIFIYSE